MDNHKLAVGSLAQCINSDTFNSNLYTVCDGMHSSSKVSVVLLDVICAATGFCSSDGLDGTVRLVLAVNSL